MYCKVHINIRTSASSVAEEIIMRRSSRFFCTCKWEHIHFTDLTGLHRYHLGGGTGAFTLSTIAYISHRYS